MVMHGDEAGRSRLTSVSGWHTGIPVSMCPAEDAQEASGPVRPGWTTGTGRQPCDGGGGSQTAKGPHTQGLFSASSRLLDDKRRCCVLRWLTTLSSACQVPGGQKGRLQEPDVWPGPDGVSSRAAPELGTDLAGCVLPEACGHVPATSCESTGKSGRHQVPGAAAAPPGWYSHGH